MAIASASCASGDSAPRDMPALSKRARMAATGSTSSIGMARIRGASSFNRSRMQDTGRSLTSAANCRYCS